MPTIPSFLLTLVTLYGVIAIFAWFWADKVIFPAPRSSYGPALPNVWLKLPDNTRIAALDLQPEEEKANGWTVLYSHGNGEDIGSIYSHLDEWRNQGFRVMAYDYPGYGHSEGRPGEAIVYSTAEAAYDYLINNQNVDPNRLLIYGRSLGSGPSWHLASTRPAAALAVEGGFTSTFRVITRVRVLPWDKFNNLAKINAVDMPILIMHGKRDIVVPYSHGKAMLKATGSRGEGFFLDEAGHNNFVATAKEAYWDAIATLLNRTHHPINH